MLQQSNCTLTASATSTVAQSLVLYQLIHAPHHLNTIMAKLFTREDPQMVHKTLGFLSLLSFFWRYAIVYPKTGTLGFNGSTFDWATIALHTLLSCSSFIFHVPKKRIANKPMVMYSEYRSHATVFTLRCASVFIIATLFPDAPTWVPPLVVAAHHKWADHITAMYGSPGNTAVRSTRERLNGKGGRLYAKVGLFYSFYQFLAIASHISPNERLADLAFNSLIAIQSSAFMMTLYRKRLVRGRTHMAVYSFCLILSAFHIIRLIGWSRTSAVTVAFAVRVNIGFLNKYQIWTGYLLALEILNNYVPVAFYQSIDTSPLILWARNSSLVALVFWCAFAVVVQRGVLHTCSLLVAHPSRRSVPEQFVMA